MHVHGSPRRRTALVPLLCLLLPIATPRPALAAIDIGVPVELPVAGVPTAVAIGDVDGDGHADVGVGSALTDSIAVFPGRGDGRFGNPVLFPLPGMPTSVQFVDATGDGRPDLVSTCTSPLVCVIPAVPGGGFGARIDLPIGAGPTSVLVADWNGDARPDLAVACEAANSISMILGTATGFAPRFDVPAGNGPADLAIGEVTGDAWPDLVVACARGQSVAILRGLGNGHFEDWAELTVGLEPRALVCADFDSDGHVDLAVADAGSNDVRLFPGVAGGGFADGAVLDAGASPRALALGDVTGDGIEDLVMLTENDQAGVVSVIPGMGGGAFGARRDHAAGDEPADLAVGHLDGDGHADVAVARHRGGTALVLLSGEVTTLALAAAPSPSDFGAPVLLTATVAPANTSGTVRFLDGGALIGVAPLVQGVATVVTSGLQSGMQSLTATFPGSPGFLPCTSPAVSHQVSGTVTRLTLTATPNPVGIGGNVTLRATIRPPSAGGEVGFYDGVTPIGQATLLAGVAQATVAFATEGPHAITAVYPGGGEYSSCTSPVVQQVIQGVADVPTFAPPPRLALAIASEHPIRGGRVRVRVSLPHAGLARLEWIEVTGRRAGMVELPDGAPGERTVDARQGLRLAPGLYHLRLSQGERAVTRRVVVVD